ncbi:hypothetical protein R2571_007047 [Pseudomonas aeruginosa]|nr:hypothetical protein [Pseudomonas aeruginosa]
MTAQTESAPQITLQQINIKLLEKNLPVIPPGKIQDVLAFAKREMLIKAVNDLDNPNALAFVKKVFVKAQLLADESEPDLEPQAGEVMVNNDDQAIRKSADQTGANERAKFHVYGGRAALCFEEDTTRGGVPTVALDAALSVGTRTYDWKKKVRIQMTRAELPVVAAVLLGKRKSCEFKSHGEDKSKGFSMERQDGGKVFVKVFEKGQGVKAVPIEAPDVFYVASIFMLQIRRSAPWLDATSTIALVGATMQQAG